MEFLSTPEFWVAVSFFLFLGAVFYFGVHKKLASALDARAAAIAKEIKLEDLDEKERKWMQDLIKKAEAKK